ncbi:hypothetical protein QM565_19070 [Geitlerinema splendidum]|nr:hypothetical protein [Geitlerinema splendidum]
MSLNKVTVLSGTALALLLPLIPQQATLAQSPSAEAQRIAQMTRSEMVSGRVTDIVGDIVSIELDNGRYEKVVLSNTERGELGLTPGMRLTLVYDGRRVAEVRREETMLTQTASSDLLDRVRRARAELESRPVRQVEVQRQTTTIQQRQTTTTPVPPPAPVAPAPTVQQQPARPIRALW